jgi:hypothetical protein
MVRRPRVPDDEEYGRIPRSFERGEQYDYQQDVLEKDRKKQSPEDSSMKNGIFQESKQHRPPP